MIDTLWQLAMLWLLFAGTSPLAFFMCCCSPECPNCYILGDSYQITISGLTPSFGFPCSSAACTSFDGVYVVTPIASSPPGFPAKECVFYKSLTPTLPGVNCQYVDLHFWFTGTGAGSGFPTNASARLANSGATTVNVFNGSGIVTSPDYDCTFDGGNVSLSHNPVTGTVGCTGSSATCLAEAL